MKVHLFLILSVWSCAEWSRVDGQTMGSSRFLPGLNQNRFNPHPQMLTQRPQRPPPGSPMNSPPLGSPVNRPDRGEQSPSPMNRPDREPQSSQPVVQETRPPTSSPSTDIEPVEECCPCEDDHHGGGSHHGGGGYGSYGHNGGGGYGSYGHNGGGGYGYKPSYGGGYGNSQPQYNSGYGQGYQAQYGGEQYSSYGGSYGDYHPPSPPQYVSGYGQQGHQVQYGGGYGSGYQPQPYGGGYQAPTYGGYPTPSYGGYQQGGYGSAYMTMGTGSGNPLENLLASLGGYKTEGYKTETEEDEEEEKEYTTPAPPSLFDGSYVDAHLKKIDEYTALQDDYKSDRLTVKVNWDLQDGKYEYLKNQHGIYPQVKTIHRPGPYGSSYGGVPYGGGGYGYQPSYGYEPPKYDHGYGYKPPSYGGYQPSQRSSDSISTPQEESS